MAKNVVIVGKLSLPNEEGQASAPYNLDLSFVYTKKAEFDQVYDVAVTDDVISLGSMTVGGAKLLLIKSSVGGCTFKINADPTSIPISVGGYELYVNTSTGFITALKISVTGPASVQLLALA